MVFLIDTNVFSDLMEEQPTVIAKLAAITPEDRICICAIVRGEILYGISRLPAGKRRETLQSRADGLFGSIVCQPISDRVADRYAMIKREMESKGTSMAENDLWIAATAFDLGASLVTRDLAFQHVAGLVIQDWTA